MLKASGVLTALLCALPAAAQDAPASPVPSPSPSAPPAVTWKDGRTKFDFEKASFTVTTRTQIRFTEQLPDDVTLLSGTSEAGQSLGSFRLRRIKTKAEGWIYSPHVTFEVQVNWAELGGVPAQAVEDINIDWDVSHRKAFAVRFGQFKVPFGRQVITSSMGQEFVDRSAVANEFAKGRDTGVEVHGAFAHERFEWRLGMFNGAGQTKFVNDNRTFQYDARLTWQPFGDPKFSEVDFESGEKPLFAVSANWERNDLRGATTAADNDRHVLGFDGVFKYRGLFATTEIYRRRLHPEGGASFRSDGWFVQGGKLLWRRKLELALRYGQWDPSAIKDGDTRHETGVALNWYENRHALKVQSDLRVLKDEARDASDTEFRLQAQFAF